LLKKAEEVGTGGADTGDRSHPEAAVRVEVARIVNETATDPKGPVAMDTMADAPMDDADRTAEPEF
jgi:hypothetical protein